MSSLLDVLQEKLSGKNVRIVLPEGEDERVLTAATKLQATDYVTPLVLGNEEKVNTLNSLIIASRSSSGTNLNVAQSTA